MLRAAVERWRLRLGVCLTSLRSTIVLAGGMPRSGSTWLFNAARLLLRDRGGLSSGWIADWHSLPTAPTVLLKVHDFDPLLAKRAVVVLCSYRDVRDVLASSKRMFDTAPTLAEARRLLDQDRRWRRSAHLAMRYESMLADPQAVVTDLATVLKVGPCDAAAVVAAVDRLSRGTDRTAETYDRETLLHPGHVTDGRHGSWAGWLDRELVARIEGACGAWLTDNGYPLNA
jgi:hypothetical protein